MPFFCPVGLQGSRSSGGWGGGEPAAPSPRVGLGYSQAAQGSVPMGWGGSAGQNSE